MKIDVSMSLDDARDFAFPSGCLFILIWWMVRDPDSLTLADKVVSILGKVLSTAGVILGVVHQRQARVQRARPRFTAPAPHRSGWPWVEFKCWNLGGQCEILEVQASEGVTAPTLKPGFVILPDDGARRDGLAIRFSAMRDCADKQPLRLVVKTARERRLVLEFRWSEPNKTLVGPA